MNQYTSRYSFRPNGHLFSTSQIKHAIQALSELGHSAPKVVYDGTEAVSLLTLFPPVVSDYSFTEASFPVQLTPETVELGLNEPKRAIINQTPIKLNFKGLVIITHTPSKAFVGFMQITHGRTFIFNRLGELVKIVRSADMSWIKAKAVAAIAEQQA